MSYMRLGNFFHCRQCKGRSRASDHRSTWFPHSNVTQDLPRHTYALDEHQTAIYLQVWNFVLPCLFGRREFWKRSLGIPSWWRQLGYGCLICHACPLPSSLNSSIFHFKVEEAVNFCSSSVSENLPHDHAWGLSSDCNCCLAFRVKTTGWLSRNWKVTFLKLSSRRLIICRLHTLVVQPLVILLTCTWSVCTSTVRK